jgi:probable phosphoglycerate mutase
MGRLILVRHGESAGNVRRIFTTDPVGLPLTELGRAQAREAAVRIRRRFSPARVITSHYDRARHTGETIATELSLPVFVHCKLYERDMGELRGQPYDTMLGEVGRDPARTWRWKPPGGESLEEVRARAGAAIDELALAHPDDDLVIVSHGGVMVSLWAHVTGRWDDAHVPPNCGIVLVEHEFGRFRHPVVVAD